MTASDNSRAGEVDVPGGRKRRSWRKERMREVTGEKEGGHLDHC